MPTPALVTAPAVELIKSIPTRYVDDGNPPEDMNKVVRKMNELIGAYNKLRSEHNALLAYVRPATGGPTPPPPPVTVPAAPLDFAVSTGGFGSFSLLLGLSPSDYQFQVVSPPQAPVDLAGSATGTMSFTPDPGKAGPDYQYQLS